MTSAEKQFSYNTRSKLLMGLSLAFTDLIMVFFAASLSIFAWTLVNNIINPAFYLQFIPLLLLFVMIYALMGLYPAVGHNPVEDLGKLSQATTVVFLILATSSFYQRNVEQISRGAFALAWVLALIFVPVGREIMRSLVSRSRWWGEPVIIFGFGSHTSRLFNQLRSNRGLGFKPVLIVTDKLSKKPAQEMDVPLCEREDLEKEPYHGLTKKIRTAVLVEGEIQHDLVDQVIASRSRQFEHIVLIPRGQEFGSAWITPYDLGGVLGLEVRQNLVSKFQQRVKRGIDLLLIIFSSPLWLPVLGLLSLAVAIDSSGKIFYRQDRIGRDGNYFRMWKFRTMVHNADEMLKNYLANHPELRQEWESNHKLKNDPRVTRLGKFLRRYSLDELPQLINVVLGEMSLVGPRPIVKEEIRFYDTRFSLYQRVLPGLTGMWQTTGRNNLTYAERVRLDEYYVRNWSVWLDLYILGRTIIAVLSGIGAY